MKNKYLTHFLPVALLSVISVVAILYLVNVYQWSYGPFFGLGYRAFTGGATVGRVYDVGYKAGFRVGDTFWEANGKPVKTLGTLRQALDTRIDALNHVIVLRDGKRLTIAFRTARLGLGLAILNFCVSWLIGVIIICIGSFIFFTTPPSENKKWSFFLFCICAGLFMIFFNQMSLWPSWIQIFQLISYCFLPATVLHMSFISPFYGDDNPGHVRFPLLFYAFSLLLLIIIRIFFSSFSTIPKYFLLFILCYFALSFLTFVITLFYQYRATSSRLSKLKIKVILIGFFISLLLPLVDPILNGLFSIFVFPNIELGTFPFILAFPLSIGYAIAKHDLFEIDVFIKRAAGYLLSTGSLAIFYVIFIFGANRILNRIPQGSSLQSSHIFNFLFILIIFFFFKPLTNKVQNFVSRVFYRRKYDYKEQVTQLLKDVSSIFKLDLIIDRLFNILSNAIFIEDINLFLLCPDQGTYSLYDPHMNRINNNSALSVPSSSPLVKLLFEEENTIHRDSISSSPRYSPVRKEVLPLFDSWKAQLIIPFITHNKMSGFITLGQMKSGRHYTISDIEFLRIIAYQIAIALENVNLFQDSIEKEKIKEELKLAGVIQRRMLPDEVPQIKNISIYAHIIPSWEIGGDFYDFIEMGSQVAGQASRLSEEKKWGIILGDVSGHGVSGALLSSAAHSICQNQALLLKDVAPMMEESNRLLVKETKKKAYVALVFALLLPDKRIVISNAGLPSALYYNNKKKEVRFLENDGERFPLGMIDDPSYIPLTVSLEEGDVILFYTDGIVEAKINNDGELFGFDRLEELFSQLVNLEPEEIANRIITEVRHLSGIDRFEDDDMTIIIVKHLETHPLDTILTLPVSLGSVGVITQCMKSLAQLSHFDEDTMAQLEAEVESTYIHDCESLLPLSPGASEKGGQGEGRSLLSDYKLVISLFPDRSEDRGKNPCHSSNMNKVIEEGNFSKTETSRQIEPGEQPKGVKAMSDRYCLELLPKDAILAESDSGRVIRLIVNFIQ